MQTVSGMCVGGDERGGDVGFGGVDRDQRGVLGDGGVVRTRQILG
jgi:hypothetical protein